MQETIWVMDSDICDECGGLIGDFGLCMDCGSDGMSDEEWEDCERDEDGYGYGDDYDLLQWAMGEYP